MAHCTPPNRRRMAARLLPVRAAKINKYSNGALPLPNVKAAISAREFRQLNMNTTQSSVVFINFSPNLLNGLICEVGTRAKQSLLRRS